MTGERGHSAGQPSPEALRTHRAFGTERARVKGAGNMPAAGSRLLALPLQQIHLSVLQRWLGKTNADTDQTHGFAGSRECLRQERAESFQRWREPRAFGRRASEIVELQFHKNLSDLTC